MHDFQLAEKAEELMLEISDKEWLEPTWCPIYKKRIELAIGALSMSKEFARDTLARFTGIIGDPEDSITGEEI